jgi:hypothetical protein
VNNLTPKSDEAELRFSSQRKLLMTTFDSIAQWILCLTPVLAVITIILVITFDREKKTCPFCAEEIGARAKVCKQCRRALNIHL